MLEIRAMDEGYLRLQQQVLDGHSLVGYASSARKGIDSDAWYEGLAERMNAFVGREKYYFDGEQIRERHGNGL